MSDKAPVLLNGGVRESEVTMDFLFAKNRAVAKCKLIVVVFRNNKLFFILGRFL